MNKDAALTILGLSGDENRVGVTQIYGERLASVQEQLVSAQSEVERNEHGARLAELSQAYELVTGTGRYSNSAEATGTVLRSGPLLSLPPSDHVSIRMEPGAVIADRFEIGALLGEGGMGRVYAARDRLKEEDVAIKVMRQDLQFSAEAKDRFLGEARVSCNLSHPNIVRVHDVGITGGTYYLSMERLKGHTLRHLMDQYRKQNRAFRIAEVANIAGQLIEALRYAHRYIVHRDIKPENIWLAEDGTVKLMDFGIARAFSNSQMTQTGMMLGTAYYMSPEQRADSKNIDWRTDQYAVGVVLYELLTGTLPTGAVQPIEKLRRDLPGRYADALMRAMAPLPKKRFKSFDQMLVEIQAPKPIRWVRLVLIGAALVFAFVSLNERGWISDPAAAGVALKAELAAASARLAESLGAPPARPGSVEVKAPEPATPEPAAPEPEAPLQVPSQANSDVSSATSLSEVSQQGDADATTPASSESLSSPFADGGIDLRRDECIAQCERDNCDDAARETNELCLDELRVCRESCEPQHSEPQ